MYIIIIVAVLIVLGCLFYASYSISAGIYIKSLCQNDNAVGSIAITFDDGIDPIMTPKVLNVLKEYNALATFFIIGEKAALHPDIVKRIVIEGHAIGNHSYYHRWYFPMKRTAKIVEEIHMCSSTLENITGDSVKLFRPPFGVTNPMISKAIRRTNMTSIGWSIRSLDTLGHEIDRVKRRVLHKIKGGEIILLHDRMANADILLDMILDDVKSKGLKTVTINEFFKIK